MKVDEDKWKWLMKRCGCIWKWRVVVGGTWSWKRDGDGSVAGNWKWTRIFQGAKGEILKKLTNGCVSVNGMEHVYNLLAGLLASTLPDHQPMHWPICYRSIDRQSMVSGLLQVCHANVFVSLHNLGHSQWNCPVNYELWPMHQLMFGRQAAFSFTWSNGVSGSWGVIVMWSKIWEFLCVLLLQHTDENGPIEINEVSIINTQLWYWFKNHSWFPLSTNTDFAPMNGLTPIAQSLSSGISMGCCFIFRIHKLQISCSVWIDFQSSANRKTSWSGFTSICWLVRP